MRRAAISLLLLAVAGPAFAADGTRVDTGPDGRAWTISNGLVERRVRFTDALGLHTDAFRRVPSGTDFLKGDKDRPEAEFDPRALRAEQVGWYAKRIAWWKALRKEIPIEEGVFPQGHWQQPNVAAWDGFARLSREGEGLLVLFRNGDAGATASVRWPAPAAGSFTLRSVEGGAAASTHAGAALSEGVALALPPAGRVAILEVRRTR